VAAADFVRMKQVRYTVHKILICFIRRSTTIETIIYSFSLGFGFDFFQVITANKFQTATIESVTPVTITCLILKTGLYRKKLILKLISCSCLTNKKEQVVKIKYTKMIAEEVFRDDLS
jgi:hypothetical protein